MKDKPIRDTIEAYAGDTIIENLRDKSWNIEQACDWSNRMSNDLVMKLNLVEYKIKKCREI